MNTPGSGMYMTGESLLRLPSSKLTRVVPELTWVRWYIRHTEWLEETDKTGAMEGNAWRLQALGPGGM